MEAKWNNTIEMHSPSKRSIHLVHLRFHRDEDKMLETDAQAIDFGGALLFCGSVTFSGYMYVERDTAEEEYARKIGGRVSAACA